MYLVSSSCHLQPLPSSQPAMPVSSLSAALARLVTLAFPVGAALALAACASKPIASSATSGPAPVVTAAQTPVANAGSGNAATPTPLAGATPAWLDPNSPISQQRSVYFTYDNDTLRSQDKAVVELQGRFLSEHPDVHVTVAGNTDERGGSEYNLALGQRRAQSVKNALGLLGVKDAQVEATSYGKEKPKAAGHDEAAWQQNRRADFMYPQK
jgi:peptidoglycan-associated lipoprotein